MSGGAEHFAPGRPNRTSLIRRDKTGQKSYSQFSSTRFERSDQTLDGPLRKLAAIICHFEKYRPLSMEQTNLILLDQMPLYQKNKTLYCLTRCTKGLSVLGLARRHVRVFTFD